MFYYPFLPSIGQDCGNLPAPNNGAVQITTTTVGGKAMYQCNTGFDLVGVTTRTCQTNGLSAQWSDTAPQCNRKSCNLIINGLSQFRLVSAINCGPLSAPFGGSIVVTSTSFQGIATYACNKGLTLMGVSQRQCQANEQWSGSAPTCQSKISHV